MERLLEIAKKVADHAEAYSLEEDADAVSVENARLKDIESKSQYGLSLRIIKDGRLGFAYTKNLLNRSELVQNAVDSLRGGVEAPFDFPLTKDIAPVNAYDPAIETLSNTTLVEECQRVCQAFLPKTKGQINLSAHRQRGQIRLINSRGTDLSRSVSAYSLIAQILYPGSYASVHRQFVGKSFERVSEEYINFILRLYNASEKEVHPRGGAMKVLFLPEAIYALIWRLQSATNGKNIYQKVSPILDKRGERIFDEKLTLYDDPLNDRMPDARAFDDEGTPCQRLSIIDRGILQNFYYDRFYAAKAKAKPTGHGYKVAMWGGEPVSFKPLPSLEHLYIQPGIKPFGQLVESMDRGMIVAGAMGAHSGNILNGDFSIGLSPGLYVEHGEILGQVKDAMTAGNIFETMKHMIDIEDILHPCYTGTFPAILFEGMSVATKS